MDLSIWIPGSASHGIRALFHRRLEILCHLGFRDTAPHLLYLSWLYSPLSSSHVDSMLQVRGALSYTCCATLEQLKLMARTGVDMNFCIFLSKKISSLEYTTMMMELSKTPTVPV